MKSKDKMLLTKILKYIDEIKTFIEGFTHEEFKDDRKTINEWEKLIGSKYDDWFYKWSRRI